MQILPDRLPKRSLIIKALCTIILATTSYTSKAQLFDSDQNPPGVKWMQISTKNFQVIFPSSIQPEAQRMANTLEAIISMVAESIGKEPRKISVILQNQGTTSNGFVQLAPRRSEYFTTPPQESDYQDWLNNLAVHELRHVVQFDKLTGNLKAPLFEELALAIFGITLPPWFYEGDAVGIETALSRAGRGRLPSWELIFRTNTLSGKRYSYSKNFLGSARDLTPGYYQLGYFMTSKLRRDYGKFILDSITSRISRRPFRPYSLSNSVREFTGLNTRQLHDSTIKELGDLWQKQSEEIGSEKYTSLNKRLDHTPSDYLMPVSISPGKYLVLKEGTEEVPAFYTVDSIGREKRVLKIGFQELPHFTYAAGKVVWDEYRFDKRYQKRSYNVINIYDLIHKQYRQLTHQSRLFAPALSPDGKTIAAVNISLENKISIVELNAETGTITRTYPNPSNLMLQQPSFSQQGDKIVYSVVATDGQGLFEINRTSNELVQLLPFQSQQISRPSYAGDNVIFRAHYNGVDNIYSYNPGTKKTFQLTSAPFGAFNPRYDPVSQQVLFNNFGVEGHNFSSIPYHSQRGKEISTIKNSFIDYAAPLAIQEGNQNVFDSIPAKTFTSRPYRELSNLFYFHSLAVIAEDVNLDEQPTFGLRFLSNNKLNTLDFYAGYQYNSGLNKSEYLAGFTYKRFYPIVDIRYKNQAQLIYRRTIFSGDTIFTPVSWREHFTETEISVPFVFNRLNQIYNFGLRISTSYTSRYEIINRPNNLPTRLMFPMKYEIYLNRNSSRSARDLAPAWGQNLTFRYRHFPFENNLQGDLFSFTSLIYTPGILKNHSFQTAFNYQQSSGAYNQSNDIPLISGYYHLTPKNELRNTLLFDYRFPLFYPDWEIGPLAYIKRFKGGFFADFENVFTGRAFSPRTLGAELRADMNLLRFYLPNFEVSGKIILVNEKPVQNPIFETGFSYRF